MNYLQHILIRILWYLDLIHVPEWDNIPSPWVKKELKAEAPKVIKAMMDKPEGTEEYLYGGQAEPGKEQRTVAITSIASEDGTAWDLARWDGSITLDFTDWSDIDDYVCSKRKFNETDIRNYQKVKPLLLQRKTNQYIAEHFDNSIRWAEKYGAAGREMIRMRIEALNPSPIEELEPGPAK